MATVAEKKRGRKNIYETYYKNPEAAKSTFDLCLPEHVESRRGIADHVYITKALWLLMKHDGEFTKQNFSTPKGKIKHSSILIQIGRMYLQDGYPPEKCIDITEQALELLRGGDKVHQVAQRIRNYRLMHKA